MVLVPAGWILAMFGRFVHLEQEYDTGVSCTRW